MFETSLLVRRRQPTRSNTADSKPTSTEMRPIPMTVNSIFDSVQREMFISDSFGEPLMKRSGHQDHSLRE